MRAKSSFRARLEIVLTVIGIIACTAGEGHTATQVITLQPGWNLITFQVLPAQRSPEAVFSSLKSETSGKPLYDVGVPLRSNIVAAFDLAETAPADGGEMEFSWRGFQQAGVNKFTEIPSVERHQVNTAAAEPLSRIEFGRAYFIFVTAILSDSRYIIEGEVVPGSTRVEFRPTWNLIGVPLQPVDSSDTSRASIGSVFRPGDLSNIKRILRWDGSSQQFRTYDVRQPDQSEFQFLDAQAGLLGRGEYGLFIGARAGRAGSGRFRPAATC